VHADNILLKLPLPEDERAPVVAVLELSTIEEYASVLRLGVGAVVEVHGTQRDLGGHTVAELSIENTQLVSLGETSFGREHKSWKAELECGSITITHLVSSKEAETFTSVYVDDHYQLAPGRMDFPRWDGTIEVHEVPEDLKIRIALLDGTAKLEFTRGFEWVRDAGSKLTRSERLVGKIDDIYFGRDRGLRDRVYREVDDFLLLVGLASDRYCQCLGYFGSNEREFSVGRRRGDVFSRAPHEAGWHQGSLIDPSDFVSFCSRTYPAFLSSDFQHEIRATLYSLRAAKESFLELSFLGMYSVLELLLARFAELNSLQLILPTTTWKQIRASIRETFKNHSSLKRTQRADLYANLEGLNRVPLRRVLESLLARYHFNLDGIWPVFQDGKLGLSSVRNLLVHGHPASRAEEFTRPLSVASYHLRWTLEIVLMALLDWPRTSSTRQVDMLSRLFPEMARPAAISEFQLTLKRLISACTQR
jgi:hypothetical protein